MKFALPLKFELPFGGAAAGLVIRTGEVEILAMKGKQVTSRVRVAIDGKEDHHLVGAIQRALEAAGLKTKRLAVSIPSQDVLVRFFTIPAVPPAELDAVVQFEARKYLPFKTDTLIWDYCAVPVPGSNQLDVVFSAVSRDLFRQVQDVCVSAGIHPLLVEPRSVSLARLVESASGTAPNEFTCVVEVEQDAAHLAIARRGVPYLTRDVAFTSSADAGVAAQAGEMDPRGQRILSELSVSMNFFLREYPSTTVSRVVLFGEEGIVGPWCRWLADQLHCLVEMGSAYVDSRVEGGLPLPFASALGLLEAAKRPAAVPIDFLKRSAVKAAAQRRPSGAGMPKLSVAELVETLRTPQAIAAVVLAACAVGGLWFMEALSVSAERDRLNQRIAARPDVGSALSTMTTGEVEQLKGKAEAQLAFLAEAVDHRLFVAAKLDAVARALPDGVWLTNLSFEDQLSPSGKSQSKLTIRGACYLAQADQELGAIHQFEEQVKRNPAFLTGFSVAQVDQIDAQTTAEKDAYRAFQMNCNSGRTL